MSAIQSLEWTSPMKALLRRNKSGVTRETIVQFVNKMALKREVPTAVMDALTVEERQAIPTQKEKMKAKKQKTKPVQQKIRQNEDSALMAPRNVANRGARVRVIRNRGDASTESLVSAIQSLLETNNSGVTREMIVQYVNRMALKREVPTTVMNILTVEERQSIPSHTKKTKAKKQKTKAVQQKSRHNEDDTGLGPFELASHLRDMANEGVDMHEHAIAAGLDELVFILS